MKRAVVYRPLNVALAVDPKAFGGEFFLFERADEKPYEIENGKAIVSIIGPLVQRHDWCWDSYEDIRARVSAAFADGECSEVLLRIDSPGGDVAGCFELARELRALSESTGKPLTAFAEGTMASAAYALGCAAQKIYCGETSRVGSIGVIEGMIDVTAQDAAMGLRYIFATSGARKGDGNPHIPATKDSFAAMQTETMAIAEIFYALVSEMRGAPSESVSALEAGIFLGRDAVSNGIADGVVTWAGLVSAKSGAEGDKPMAKKLTEYLAALADGEDKDEAAKAKKALAALLAEDEGAEPSDDDKKKDEEAKAAAAKAEEEKKAAAASAAEPPKDSSASMKAAAATGDIVASLALQVHNMKAERAAEKDALTRAAIFAARPDIDADTIKALASTPTKDLKTVVDRFVTIVNPAAAAQVTGTQGRTENLPPAVNAAEQAFIDTRLGLNRQAQFTGSKGSELHLGLMTPDEARARLAKSKEGN